MQIVIDIPDTAYQGILNANNASGNWNDDLLGVLCRGVANGTPLPKGHGRLIDADAFCEKYDSNINGNIDGDYIFAPTIIEADKVESEDNDEKSIYKSAYERAV